MDRGAAIEVDIRKRSFGRYIERSGVTKKQVVINETSEYYLVKA